MKSPKSTGQLLFLLLLLCPVAAKAQALGVTPDIAFSVKPSDPVKTEPVKTDKNTDKPKKDSAPGRQPNELAGLLKRFKFNIEMGGQITIVSDERPSKFEEFRQVREGYLFRKLRVASNPEGSPFFFNLIAKSPSEVDQHYLLDFGKFGSYRTRLEWSELPHLYSRGSRSLFGSSGRGILTIPDQIQQTLQNATDANLPGLVQGLISSAPPATLRVYRETLDFNQRVNLTEHLSARFRLLDQKRFGAKPLGTGSYERIGTASGDTFRVLSIELPESVDSRHDQLTFGVSYVREKWGLNFDYTFSKFRNRIHSLAFDNPFRATDLQATGSGGVFNRMAFARGVFALPPDNGASSFLLSGFVDLPHNSRWASAIGWNFWRQDEDFVPYTLNGAIVASGLKPGTSVTDVNSLPRRSLEGSVDTFSQDHLFTTELSKKWRVNLHYRSYFNDNTTPEIVFPGYAAFGESYWRTNINGKPIENEPLTFRRQTATAEAVWNISKPLDWKWDYKWEGWNRHHRQAARTNEHTVGTQLSYRHSNHLSGKLDYHYSDRSPRFYDPGILEFSQLRMFDQSKRLRHNANLQVQWQVKPQVGISGTLGYQGDDYDQNFFGLTKYVQGYGSIDLLYTALENTTFYTNYSRERYSSTIQQIAKTAAPFNLNNRWNRDERDVVDSFGVGVTTYLAKDKLFLDAHYALAFGKTRMTTANPGTPLANSLINATAYPFPDVKTRFQEFNSDISYQITPNVAFGVRYLYEPYRLNDFAWNGLTPYPLGAMASEHDGRRFLLLDSRYSSHDAHVLGVYLRFTR